MSYNRLMGELCFIAAQRNEIQARRNAARGRLAILQKEGTHKRLSASERRLAVKRATLERTQAEFDSMALTQATKARVIELCKELNVCMDYTMLCGKVKIGVRNDRRTYEYEEIAELAKRYQLDKDFEQQVLLSGVEILPKGRVA